MSTTAHAPLLRPLDRAPRVTFARVTRAEGTKLTSVRSSWLIGLLTIALSAAAGAAIAATEMTDPAAALAGGVGTSIRTIAPAVVVGEMFISVLAVLFVTQEFATGQKRVTYAAVPKRLPVLAAKTIVAAVVALILSVVSSVAAWATSSAVLSRSGLRTSLFDPAVLQSIGASAAWLVLLTVFSVMIATLLRNSAASIALVLGVLLVLPIAVRVITGSSDFEWSSLLLTYSETTMNQLITGTEPAADLGRDLVVTAAWLLVPMAAAAWATVRRDV